MPNRMVSISFKLDPVFAAKVEKEKNAFLIQSIDEEEPLTDDKSDTKE